MSEQYRRKVSLIVADDSGNGLELSAFRVVFQTKQVTKQTPNVLYCRIYNLSDDTMQKIGLGTSKQVQFRRVRLQAGYDNDDFGTIFEGQIKQTVSGRESMTDRFLEIYAADADQAYNYAYLNTSLEAGSTTTQQVAEIVKSMQPYGITEGYISGLPTEALPRAKVLYGPAKDRLRQISAYANVDFSLQNGKLVLVPIRSYAPDPAVVLTAKTGLVDLPRQTEDGIHITCLLNPQIKPTRRVWLNNASIQQFGLSLEFSAVQFVPKINNDGFYKCIVVEHMGDTRGNDYYTNITAIAIDGTVTPSLAALGYAAGPNE